MAIVNEFGQPFRFAHAATRSRYRGPIYTVQNKGADELIPEFDRDVLCSLSRRLFTNMGVPRGAILQKADYSVGEAWLPRYTGPDKQNGKAVETWLRENFLPACDIRGGVHDWWTLLRQASVAVDRDGDAFILITTEGDPVELPRLQLLPSYLIRSKINEKIVPDGPYKGRKILNGIIYDGRSRALAYRVSTGDKPTDFYDAPARAVIHLYDPQYCEDGRGLPAFTHAIEDLKHMLKSTEDERVRQQMLSSIGLIEHNEIGGPDLTDPRNLLDNVTSTGEGLAITEFEGGKIRYFAAGSGSRIEQLKHESPGEIWENFHDRMIRSAIAGVKWSYSLAWKPMGQGTAERADLEKARRAVKERQSLLWYLGIRAISYAYAKAQQAGFVPMLEKPTAWSFSYPAKLTVDDGRELQGLINGWRAGVVNMTEIVEARGDTIESHYETRAREIAIREMTKEAAEEEYDIEIDSREMAMLTPNEQPDAEEPEMEPQAPQEPEQPDQEEDEPDQN